MGGGQLVGWLGLGRIQDILGKSYNNTKLIIIIKISEIGCLILCTCKGLINMFN
jgi:hypothetical protein